MSRMNYKSKSQLSPRFEKLEDRELKTAGLFALAAAEIRAVESYERIEAGVRLEAAVNPAGLLASQYRGAEISNTATNLSDYYFANNENWIESNLED
jgi:hypothetical protein